MINYNSTDPEHIKERQNVVPPTIEEVEYIVDILNGSFEGTDWFAEKHISILQRLIYDYENKSHFHDVVGGWEGVSPELVYATQEWSESDTSKTGWEGSGWILPQGFSQANYELEYIVDQDKFYNPTKAIFKLIKENEQHNNH